MDEELSLDEQIIAEKTVCVLLVRGEDPEGSPIYAYVAVRADRLQEFMTAQDSGTFYPEDYGVIVEAGEGEPTEAIRQRMETEYGFRHDGMIDIPDPSAAHGLAANIIDVMPMQGPLG